MNRRLEIILQVVEKGIIVDRKGNVFNGGKPLKLRVNSRGYYTFKARIDKESYPIYVSWLQAYTKFGEEALKEGIVVRHKDGEPLNNSWENILIGTQSDNMMDIPEEKRILNASNPVYDHEAILADRNLGLTYNEIMLKYGISSKGTVSFIVNKSLAKIDKNSKQV